jgi:hypothetical protein
VSRRWLPDIRLRAKTATRERNAGTEEKWLHDEVMMTDSGLLSNAGKTSLTSIRVQFFQNYLCSWAQSAFPSLEHYAEKH